MQLVHVVDLRVGLRSEVAIVRPGNGEGLVHTSSRLDQLHNVTAHVSIC
jgi:hypothetical protein